MGLTDEEAKSAFNRNMLSTGLLSESPAEFGRSHNRRWLVTDYSAGDVVLHNPYAVRYPSKNPYCSALLTSKRNVWQIHASTLNHDPNHVIRLATDLRFADSRQPWDQVSPIDKFGVIIPYTPTEMVNTVHTWGWRLK
jgi:phytanoyl-CoA hydroxylase